MEKKSFVTFKEGKVNEFSSMMEDIVGTCPYSKKGASGYECNLEKKECTYNALC